MLLLLSILDITAGISLLLRATGIVAQFFIVVHSIKGLWSVITSASNGYYLDVLGWLDIATGIVFYMYMHNIFILSSLGYIMLVKGIISLS